MPVAGYALLNLSEESDVPWQRVVNASGRISLSRETLSGDVQQSLLEGEGVTFSLNGTISLNSEKS